MSTLTYMELMDLYIAWCAELAPAQDRIPFAEWCARLGEPGGIQ